MPDPQEKPKRQAPADLLRSPEGRAQLDSIAAMLGAPNIFQADRGKVSRNAMGTFKDAGPDANQLYLSDRRVPQGWTPQWVASHEAEHARDFYDRGPLGKLFYLLEGLIPAGRSASEARAETGASAMDLVRRINDLEDVDIAVGVLQSGLADPKRLSPVSDPIDPEALRKRIQDISRHPYNRGSMIRRALLGAGYELR